MLAYGRRATGAKEGFFFLFFHCWIHHEKSGENERWRKRGASCALLHILSLRYHRWVFFFCYLSTTRALHCISIRRDRRSVSLLYRHDERWEKEMAAEHIYITPIFGTSNILLASGKCRASITYNCCTFGTSDSFSNSFCWPTHNRMDPGERHRSSTDYSMRLSLGMFTFQGMSVTTRAPILQEDARIWRPRLQ
jgi:hypothetical protein